MQRDLTKPQQFLVWTHEKPFLATWQPEGRDGRLIFAVADTDYRGTFADQPVTFPVRKAVVEVHGLEAWAEKLAEIQQGAQEVENRYTALIH